MSKINKVLYNVDQTDDTSEAERRLARKNIGLDEVIGHATTDDDTGIAPLGENGLVPAEYLPSFVNAVVNGYYYNGKFYREATHTTEISPDENTTYVDITVADVGVGYRWTQASGYFQISSQNAFGALKAGNVTIHADQPMDLLTIVGDSGITVAVADTRSQEQNGSDKLTIGHSNSIVAGRIGEESPTTQINNTFNLPWASFDAQGHITATGSNAITIKNATTGQYGVTKLTSTPGTDETLAMTPKGVQTAIAALEYSDTVVVHQFVTEVDEADGVISVTRAQPSTSDISGLSDALAAKQDALTAGQNVSIGDVGGVLTISATDTTYSAGTNVSISDQNVISATDTTYSAGNNVSISDQNVISATDTTYSAGAGLNLDGTEFSVDTTTIATKSDLSAKQDTLTAGSNVRIDNNVISATDTTYTAGSGLALNGTVFSNAAPNVKSDWNASVGSDAFILNKPVVIEGQLKLQVGGTKQFKNLTIDNSGFAGSPAPVSVTSTEDTTYTPGYLVTPAGSANKYLRSGTGGVPEWDILDMGTYEEYDDEETSVSKDLTKIYVEKLYNGNERIKFNTESSYKYLVPPPSPNRQLVTNSSGVMQWDTINAIHEIVFRESNGTQVDSTIYNDVSYDVESGKTPMLWSAGDYGRRYYYIFKRRVGGYSSQPITYVFEGNDTVQNRIIRKLITNGTITTEVVPLQGRLTAGSGISIDYNTNEIMCTGSGQVVDGVFKQVDSAGTRYTIQFGIGDRNNPFLDLVKTDITTTTDSTLSATHINEEEVQSNRLALMPLGSNSYKANFWMSQHNTTGNPGRTSEVCQLPTAIHSIYDGTLSAQAPGNQEMPIDRVTLYGNKSHSFVVSNLGNLTVGSLAMRIVNSSDTSAEHPLLASCVQGELTFVRVSNNNPLHTKHYNAECSYLQAGESEYDGWLALTTKARTLSDADSRSAAPGANGLGCLTFFPSKNYVDDKTLGLNNRIGRLENKSYYLDIDNSIANNRMIFTLSGETASGGSGYVDIELLPHIEAALGKSTGYISTHRVHAFVIATITIESNAYVDVNLVPVPAGGTASPAVYTWHKAGHNQPYTIAFPVISLTNGLYLRCHYSNLTAWTCNYSIDCTVIPCDAVSV